MQGNMVIGAHRHASAFRALHAIVHANHRRPRGGIFLRELAMSAAEIPVQLRDALRRVLLHLVAKLLESDGVALDVICIMQILVDDDMHQAERQGRIGARIDGQIPVGARRRCGCDRDR